MLGSTRNAHHHTRHGVDRNVSAPSMTDHQHYFRAHLDDPSRIGEYEELTLAELDRVAAAVFVFVSPPGPAGEELRLLGALASHGVDKAFLVCNFYPDHWADPETRNEVTEYIESIVSGGADEGVSAEDVHVYALSAKSGLAASRSDDAEAFDESGVGVLRRDLERFLAKDALPRTLGAVERRIDSARSLVLDALLERARILNAPHLVASVRDDHQRKLETSRRSLRGIIDEINRAAEVLGNDLAEIMDHPYRTAATDIEQATTIRAVEEAEHRMRLLIETAASRSSMKFSQTAAVVEQRVRRELFDTFGVDERLAKSGHGAPEWSRLAGGEGLATLASSSADWSAVGSAAGLAAVGGGLIGGAVLGGAGLALLAVGPVGWLIGLAVGGALSAATAGSVAGLSTRGRLDAADRSKILSSLQRQRTEAAQLAAIRIGMGDRSGTCIEQRAEELLRRPRGRNRSHRSDSSR